MQEHVKMTKNTKHAFFAENNKLGTQKAIATYCPIRINQI